MNQEGYAQYLKNDRNKPKTPRLQQLNTNLDGERKIQNNSIDGRAVVTSPQGLQHTPQFDNIQIFPTPMSYLPSSPIQGLGLSGIIPPAKQEKPSVYLPQTSEIHIKKRRDKVGALRNFELNEINNLNNQHKDSRNLDEVLKSEHRIVSELVPAPSISPQRISSLPTVGEDLEPLGLGTSSTKLDESSQISTDQKGIEINKFTDSNIDILEVFVPPQFDQTIKLNRIKQIGKGNFSVVELYQNLDQKPSNPNAKLVAVKKIIYPDNLFYLNHHGHNNELLSSFESSLTRELSVLQKLNHPCIIHLYGINNPIFLTDKTPLTTLLKQNNNMSNKEKPTVAGIPDCDIIISYCHGGDLLNALTECNGNLETQLVQRIFAELSLAVKYLHDNLIIHRDLKLENILLTCSLDEIKLKANNESERAHYLNTNIIQLTDFGLCKEIDNYDELCTARCGSEDYVSPEILMGVPYDGRLSDSWAMGVILYCLLEDRLPFDPPVNANIRQRRRATSHRIASFEWRWNKMKDINMVGKDIVNNTLTRKNKRWDINNIIESPFVTEVTKELTFI
ncbi:serine/threonine-protein kinase Prr1p [Monosporozyma unispora]|nr:hypothetical protein C6P44_000971 [Kazachstania unispora]